jgi:hypothetical protein
VPAIHRGEKKLETPAHRVELHSRPFASLRERWEWKRLGEPRHGAPRANQSARRAHNE